MGNVFDVLFGRKDKKLNRPLQVQQRLLGSAADLVIFDVGAYVGKVTAAYKKAFPRSTIYCFEPFADSFQRLSRSCQDASIYAHQLAFSDREGKATLHLNTDASCNSFLPRPQGDFKHCSDSSRKTGEIQVETTTLDIFCTGVGISNIDILKLDVEGSEVKVLKGASEMLTGHAIRLIYAEAMFIPHYEGGCMFHELTAFLNLHGYTLFNLYHLKSARNGQLRWGNAIFVSPGIRSGIKNPSAV